MFNLVIQVACKNILIYFYCTGLALCGVGYDAQELRLKKHNIMALDKTEGDGVGGGGKGVGGGGGEGVGGAERLKKKRNGLIETDPIAVPKRKLFKVIISASFCILYFTFLLNLLYIVLDVFTYLFTVLFFVLIPYY